MNKTELNEKRAIAHITSRKESLGYRKAVEANIPVVFLEKSTVVRLQEGEKTTIARIKVSKKLKTPIVYRLK